MDDNRAVINKGLNDGHGAIIEVEGIGVVGGAAEEFDVEGTNASRGFFARFQAEAFEKLPMSSTMFANMACLMPPKLAAMVNSTLGLMALIAGGDHVGLMPMPIASHPAASQFMDIVPIREGHLALKLGAIYRQDALLKPVVRHFLSHLHRAAHQARLDHGKL